MLTGHSRWYSPVSVWGRPCWGEADLSLFIDMHQLELFWSPVNWEGDIYFLEIKEVVCWGQLPSNCKILSFQQSSRNHEVNHHASSLKLVIKRIFAPWRMASTTNQGFPLPERWLLNIYLHTPGQESHLPHGLGFTMVFGGR